MKSAVNLLPTTVQRRELIRRRARHWGAVWAMAAAIALGIGGARHFFFQTDQTARREAEQRQNDRLAKVQQRLADARAKLSTLQAQEAALSLPDEDASGLTVLGIVSRCARRAEGTIRVEAMSIAGKPSPSGTAVPRDGAPRKDPRLLTLRVLGVDSVAVTALATGLRDAGAFASVEQKPLRSPAADGKQPVSCLIECTF